MSGKIEYLEKYSVARAPSRDYYGLKVLRDEVILHLWKVSHGPHKTPIVRTVKFIDFEQDKSLQDEIQRGFGEHLLKHVRNIVRGGTKTLLTLPKSLIERLSKYLSVNDIISLSLLSHVSNEIFNDNTVWKVLYKRYNSSEDHHFDRHRVLIYGWKQLFKEEKMQALTYTQKKSGMRSVSKLTKTKPERQGSTQHVTSRTKQISKFDHPVNNIPKKLDVFDRTPRQDLVSKKLSHIRLTGTQISEGKKPDSETKSSVKSIQSISQRNIKNLREQSAVSKKGVESTIVKSGEKCDQNSLFNKSVKTKALKTVARPKTSSTDISRVESKLSFEKPKKSTSSKATVSKMEKPQTHTIKNNSCKSNVRNKGKKIEQTKSTILSTNIAFVPDFSAVQEDSFGLTDLIEASLKNTRNPSYNFSCLQSFKSSAGDAKSQNEPGKKVDGLKKTKTNRVKTALERLSERSEPLNEITDSPDGTICEDDQSETLETRNRKIQIIKPKKSAVSDESVYPSSIFSDSKIDSFERYGIYNKRSTPRLHDRVEEKKSAPRKPLDRMNLLRSLKSSNLTSETNFTSNKNAATITKNRYVS